MSVRFQPSRFKKFIRSAYSPDKDKKILFVYDTSCIHPVTKPDNRLIQGEKNEKEDNFTFSIGCFRDGRPDSMRRRFTLDKQPKF